MANEYVKARYTFVNENGLVIPKNATGLIIKRFSCIRFLVDGDLIDCIGMNSGFLQEINIEDLGDDAFKAFEY